MRAADFLTERTWYEARAERTNILYRTIQGAS